MSQALQAAFHGLGLQLPVIGQQQPAAEQEGRRDVQVYLHIKYATVHTCNTHTAICYSHLIHFNASLMLF